MFRRCLEIALAAVMAVGTSAAAAAPHVVTIAGKTYATGLLPTPKDAPRTFFSPAPFEAAALPDAYDSRTDTACIPAVRNQGNCGSCWDFATTGAFETAQCLATGVLTDLSEQDQLTNNHSAYGCDGGFMTAAWLQDQGETTEALCPYRANDSVSCRGAKFAKATRWALLGASGRAPTTDEMKAAIVQYKALFVTVASAGLNPDSNGRVSGSNCNRRGVDHMVQIVGYRPAPDGGVEYIMKNSWGGWGLAGYAYLKQGCTELASTPGDAAGFVYVAGAPDPDPNPDPVPQPLLLGLPLEVIVQKAQEFMLEPINPKSSTTYRWSTGIVGARIKLQATGSTVVSLKATDRKGAVTEQAVKITVK